MTELSDKLLPDHPPLTLKAGSQFVPVTRCGSTDSPVLEMDKLIRVLATHPDGGVIYEEIIKPGDLKRMETDPLRDDYRLLPDQVTPERIAEALADIQRCSGDGERARGIEHELLAETLRTIAVYELTDQEASDLATTVLVGLGVKPD